MGILWAQTQESDDGQNNTSRLVRNDRRHADLRDHRLVCAGVRATGTGCGVLALRVRGRHLAADLRCIRFPAPRYSDPYHLPLGLAIVGNWVLLFASYSRASIAIGTAVYNVQPFMLVGLAALFLNEKITLQKMAWLGVSFLGMLAIVSAHGGQGESGNEYLIGIVLALGAAFLYAIAALIIKRLTGTPPHLIALIQVSTGVLLLVPFAHFSALPQATSAWASLVTLGIVHTGVMYVLLYGAIQKLPTALTGALSFIYPIAAIFVDWFAFGHRLQPLQWIGVAAILLAAAGMQQGWGLKLRRTVVQ